jgi:hypothetical protein
MNEETIKLIHRLKSTSDGKDFINYLVNLSRLNYIEWKSSGGDVLRGKAIAFDQLIQLFDTIEEKTVITKEINEWM